MLVCLVQTLNFIIDDYSCCYLLATTFDPFPCLFQFPYVPSE
ncbi:hypothetical protein SLEP1_g19352 [Rubroshorea leprosula]|nr:hypothetical protein SLEP1_g19352 [Rubroshorea leprosula]